VLTFNVWIQGSFMDVRIEALVAIMRDEQVDLAALQEATPKHLEQLHAHPYIRSRSPD
jgi:endonuclease/exonuclease/phosphatase family metal-dependent hydrolase